MGIYLTGNTYLLSLQFSPSQTYICCYELICVSLISSTVETAVLCNFNSKATPKSPKQYWKDKVCVSFKIQVLKNISKCSGAV